MSQKGYRRQDKSNLPEKHKKWQTIPPSAGLAHSLFSIFRFSSPSTFSALLHLHLSSFTTTLLRSKKNRHLGAFLKHLTPVKFKRQTSPTLVYAFFSGVWREEGRMLEQGRTHCCENLLSYHKSPHKSPWNNKAPSWMVKKELCKAITFTILGRMIPIW